MEKKNTENRVVCALKGAHVYKDIFEEINARCVSLGETWHVIVTYDIEHDQVVCDVYENPKENKLIAEGLPLDMCLFCLVGLDCEKKSRKKAFTEAAEIAADKDAEYFRVHEKDKDPSGGECDYKLVIRNDETNVYYHDSEGWYSLILDLDSEGWKREYLEVGGDKQ